MKYKGDRVASRDKRRKDIVAEFKRLFDCTRVIDIYIDDVDYWEQDMMVWATLYRGKYLIGRPGIFLQFEADSSITKGSGDKDEACTV